MVYLHDGISGLALTALRGNRDIALIPMCALLFLADQTNVIQRCSSHCASRDGQILGFKMIRSVAGWMHFLWIGLTCVSCTSAE